MPSMLLLRFENKAVLEFPELVVESIRAALKSDA